MLLTSTHFPCATCDIFKKPQVYIRHSTEFTIDLLLPVRQSHLRQPKTAGVHQLGVLLVTTAKFRYYKYHGTRPNEWAVLLHRWPLL